MGRQFSIPTVLRMVPNAMLGAFFEQMGHDLGIDWAGLKQKDIRPIMEALNRLPRQQYDQVESELRSVFDLACEPGIDAIIEAARSNGETSLVEAMPPGAGFYARSMWAWLSHRKSFDKATVLLQPTGRCRWRKRNDLPRCRPDTGERAIGRLEREISELLLWEQGRGHACTVEVMQRGNVFYFFAYPDDFVQNVVAHDEQGQLAAATYRRTFQIVFEYDCEEGTLQLRAGVPAKLKCRLEEIFVRTILERQLGPWTADPVYELDHLKYHSFRLETDPNDRLWVRIRKMRLAVANSKRKIWIEVDVDDPTDDIHRAMTECLHTENLPLSRVRVTQATFCFQFLPLDGRKAGRLSFDIGYPCSCGLGPDPPERVRLVKKYLKLWNIDRVRTAEARLATA